MLYEEIGDARGLSDAYEQLGCIALAAGQGREAVSHLQRSLFMRRQLHNQQGEASSLRHLAIAYVTQGQLGRAFKHMRQSLPIYYRLGVLGRQARGQPASGTSRSWAGGRRQLEKVKARDRQFELVIFFQRVMDKAISTRLAFAQRERDNYQTLEDELPNLWEVVQTSLSAKSMEGCFVISGRVAAFSRSTRLLATQSYVERMGH